MVGTPIVEPAPGYAARGAPTLTAPANQISRTTDDADFTSAWEMPMGQLLSIPWSFIDNEFMRLWTWRTNHFEARISADQRSHAWEIVDFVNSSDGNGRFLMEGRHSEFIDAENSIREHIGKSYPYRLGYSTYAGALATTFTIATGKSIDFGSFGAQEMTLNVMTTDGQERSYTGRIDTLHYEVTVTPSNGRTLKIRPTYIVSVTHGGREAEPQQALTNGYTGIGRMYRGTVDPGCTGSPGYMPNTIDHTGVACPIHEEATFRSY